MKELLALLLKFILALAQLTDIADERCCTSVDEAKKCAMTDVCEKHVWNRPTTADRVSIHAYGEAHCPDTQRWIINQLYPTWQSLGGIMDVQFFPYGKATQVWENGRWKFTCQHGPDECLGNQIFTCAIKLYNETRQWLPFIHCVENTLYNGENSVAAASETCAQTITTINLTSVMKCSESKNGNTWEHEMGVATEALQPPLDYVPWMVVDSKHTAEIQQNAEHNLKKTVCDDYKGRKPSACLMMYAAEQRQSL